jgi:hypothetical protein
MEILKTIGHVMLICVGIGFIATVIYVVAVFIVQNKK